MVGRLAGRSTPVGNNTGQLRRAPSTVAISSDLQDISALPWASPGDGAAGETHARSAF